MIRHENNLDSPAPYCVIVIGENVKVIENPRLTGAMPFWQQEMMLNAALREARPNPPRRERFADVVPIEVLRALREVRVASGSGFGT